MTWFSLRVCSITHNPSLDSESRFTRLASCNWMHNPKTDCTLNMVTVTFLLQHLFYDDEGGNDPSIDVSTVLEIAGSLERCRTMQTGGTQTNLTPSGINWTENLNPDLDFGWLNEQSKTGLGLIQTRIQAILVWGRIGWLWIPIRIV